MAGFSGIFQEGGQLGGLDARGKMGVLDAIYSEMQKMPDTTSGDLAAFRGKQMETLYEDMKGRGATMAETPEDFHRNMKTLMYMKQAPELENAPEAGGMKPALEEQSAGDMQIFKALYERDKDADLQDLAKVATTDPKHWPLAAMKMTADFGGMMYGLAKTLPTFIPRAGSKYVADEQGNVTEVAPEKAMDAYNEGFKQYNSLALVERMNKEYERQTADNPALFHRVDSAVSMALMGLVSGAGRLGARYAAETALLKQADMATLLGGNADLIAMTLPEKTRVLASSAMAQVAADQIIYPSVQGLERMMHNSDLPEDTKQGLLMAGMVFGGLVAGVGMDKLFAATIGGVPGIGEKVARLGEVARQDAIRARLESGATADSGWGTLGEQEGAAGMETPAALENSRIGQFILDNPEATELLQGIVRDLQEGQGLPGITPEALEGARVRAQERIGIEGKARLGEELSVEEAGAQAEMGAEQVRGASFTKDEFDVYFDSVLEFGPDEKLVSGITKDAFVNKGLATLDELRGLQRTARAQGDEASAVELQGKIDRVSDRLAEVLGDESGIEFAEPPRNPLSEKEMQGRVRDGLEDADLEVAPTERVEATADSVMELVEALEPAERMQVKGITEMLRHAEERRAAARMEQPAYDELMARVYNQHTAWGKRVFVESEEPYVFNPSVGEWGMSAGWVETKFPMAAKVLRLKNPTSTETQIFSRDSVLHLLQGVSSRTGLGMDAAGFSSVLPVLNEVSKLWDVARAYTPKAMTVEEARAGMKQFLTDNSKQFGIRPEYADKIADSVMDAFPQLNVALEMSHNSRAIALADALQKTIVFGKDAKGLEVLTHELGHMHYYYVLDSDARLGWLQDLRQNVGDAERWAMAYPKFNERWKAARDNFEAGKISESQLAEAAYALHDPAEIYAEQASMFFMSDVLPKVDQLRTFGRLQQGIRKLLEGAGEGFLSLPESTKKFFYKSMVAPDVADAVKVPVAAIERAMRDNIYAPQGERGAGLVRVQDIEMELGAKYDAAIREQVLAQEVAEGMVQPGLDVPVEGIRGFWELTPEERVAIVTPEDALALAERQALMLWEEGPASLAEMNLAMDKAGGYLEPSKRGELIATQADNWVRSEDAYNKFPDYVEPAQPGDRVSTVGVEDRKLIFDQRTYRNKQVLNKITRILEGDSPIEGGIALEELNKADMLEMKVEFMMYWPEAMQVFKNMETLAKFKAARLNGPKEVAAWASEMTQKYAHANIEFTDVNKAVVELVNTKELATWKFYEFMAKKEGRAVGADVRENIEYLQMRAKEDNPFMYTSKPSTVVPRREFAVSATMSELNAMDWQYGKLQEFINGALAKRGMIDVVDSSFVERLSRAETFAQAFALQGKGLIDWATVGSAAARGGLLWYAGLEYDENGDSLPIIGKARWNYEKAMRNPLAWMLAMPKKGYRYVLQQGKKVAEPVGRNIWNKTPVWMKEKVQKNVDDLTHLYKSLALEYGGAPKDVVDMINRTKARAHKSAADMKVFAEYFFDYYPDLKDRQLISSVLSNKPGYHQIEATMMLDPARKGMMADIAMTRQIFGNMFREWDRLGIIPEKYQDMAPAELLADVLTNVAEPDTIVGVLKKDSINQVSGKMFADKRVSFNLSNTRVNGKLDKAKDKLITQSELEGLELTRGQLINSYRDPQTGRLNYAIVDSLLDKRYKSTMEPDRVWSDKTEGYTVAEDYAKGKAIKLERRYTAEEEAFKGRAVDISLQLAKTGDILRADYQKGMLYDKIASSEYAIMPHKQNVLKNADGTELAFSSWEDAKAYAESRPDEWVFVKDKTDKLGLKKYGNLTGGFVRADVYDAIRFSQGNQLKALVTNAKANKWWGTYRALLKMFKVNKTVFTPTAHMNNFVSNIMMGSLLGHNSIAEIKDGYKFIRWRSTEGKIKELQKQGKGDEAKALMDKMMEDADYSGIYAEIKNHSMADTSMFANEMKTDDFLSAFLRQAEEQGGVNAAPQNGLGAYAMSLGADAMTAASRVGKRIGQKAGSLYESGDLIFKMGAYARARKKGFSEGEALRYAYEAYFDYSSLSSGAKFLRDTGIVPFVSYIYKVIPALYKVVKDNPGKLAAFALALEGIHIGNIAREYGADDLLKKRDALDTITPSHMGKRGFFNLLRTRMFMGIDSQGANRFLDISRMAPGGDFGETDANPYRPPSSGLSLLRVGEMLNSVINQSPMLNLIATAGSKVNASMQQPLARGSSTLEDAVVIERMQQSFAELAWNTFMPNLPFIHGTYSNKEWRAGLAGIGLPVPGETTFSGMDRYGQPRSLATAAASSVGIKLRAFNQMDVSRYSKYMQYEVGKEKSLLKSVVKSPSYTHDYKQKQVQLFQELENRQKGLLQRRGEAQQTLMKALQDAKKARQREQGGRALPQ